MISFAYFTFKIRSVKPQNKFLQNAKETRMYKNVLSEIYTILILIELITLKRFEKAKK